MKIKSNKKTSRTTKKRMIGKVMPNMMKAKKYTEEDTKAVDNEQNKYEKHVEKANGP